MNKNVKLDKLFYIIASIQTVIMGILFIIQILRIYYGNNHEFNSEICKRYILQILPVIILWILAIVLSYIYHNLYKNKINDKAKITNKAKLENLKRICNLDADNIEEERVLLAKESKKLKIAKIVNIVIVVLCSIMGLCYLLNVNHFKSDGDIQKQAIDMGLHLLPWVIISFTSFIIVTIYEEIVSLKSMEIIKSIIKTNGKKPFEYDKNLSNKILLICRLSIIVIAVALIIVGVIDDGYKGVLLKAINICTECIGLG